jgi:hypothetical protein
LIRTQIFKKARAVEIPTLGEITGRKNKTSFSK